MAKDGQKGAVTRFAPSPSGLLHLGHAYSALFARSFAGVGGRFLLRIEDIDPGRCRPDYEAAIYEDLEWLGLRWEPGVRRQSEHMNDYARALERLDGMGLVYPCFCTRAGIRAEIDRSGAAPHGPDGPVYPGLCRGLPRAETRDRIAAGEAHALRLDMARAATAAGPLVWHDRERGRMEARSEIFGDVVLARKDTPTGYHLAVTVDDHIQEITLVTRGEDLLPATHIHRLLQALLGLETPEYRHHRLLVDDAGRRLAKRHDSLSIRSLRERGRTREEVRAMAGFGTG